jgi:inhibitor of cysteine peptidase
MKKSIIFGLAAVLLLPILAVGCRQAQSSDEVVPASAQTQKIEITMDDFAAQPSITRDVELKINEKLEVSLGSNPTTGYQWGEAEITDTSVVVQESRSFVEPQSDALGAPGKDVWTLTTMAPGQASITMLYDRPWENGGKPLWAITINVTVK